MTNSKTIRDSSAPLHSGRNDTPNFIVSNYNDLTTTKNPDVLTSGFWEFINVFYTVKLRFIQLTRLKTSYTIYILQYTNTTISTLHLHTNRSGIFL